MMVVEIELHHSSFVIEVIEHPFRVCLSVNLNSTLIQPSFLRVRKRLLNLVERRIIQMISSDPNESSRLSGDGLSLEIDAPEVIAFAIPKRQPGIGAPIRLNVYFHNNTPTPVPITLCGTLTPELKDSSGQAVGFSAPQQFPYEDEFVGRLVLPGESILEILEARLFWDFDQLRLLIPIRSYIFQENPAPLNQAEYWVSEALEAGTYQLQFVYRSPAVPLWRSDPTTGEEVKFQAPRIENLATSPVHLSLIEPLPNLSIIRPLPLFRAIEVEGICFETVVTPFKITLKKREKEISLKLGISITNNTATPLLFSFYSALTPDLIAPDGSLVPRYYGTNYFRPAEASDFPLLNSGESQTLLLDVSLTGFRRSGYRYRQFNLAFPLSSGGWYSFGNLRSGKYQLQFNYTKPKLIEIKKFDEWQPIESMLSQAVWSGSVSLPSVDLDFFLS
jgi:hypothetical protein